MNGSSPVHRVARAILAIALAAGCAPTPAPDPVGEEPVALPEIVVEGPDSVRPAIEGVRRAETGRLRTLMRLVGLRDPGPPIRVLVLPEDSAAARDAPAWVAGWADGDDGLVVLFPERGLPYPHDTFTGLVAHEVAHVLIDRAAGHRPVPRWFHEGLASAAGDWGMDDRSRVTVALLFGADDTVAELEAAFASDDPRRIGRAYALAGALMREVLARSGGAAARILAALSAGEPFDEAFANGTGMRLSDAERLFWGGDRRWRRWVRLLADSAVLWTGIAALALWALWRRRRRAAEIRRRWQEEEERAAGGDPPFLSGPP